jgi:transposase-like protein
MVGGELGLETVRGFVYDLLVFQHREKHMNPLDVFCPNMACPARGQVNKGNVIGHGRKRPRFRCTVCGTTFSPRSSTPFHRRSTAVELIVQVVTLVSFGCPIPAIEAAFGLQARTVREWVRAAGRHSDALQQHLVQQPQDLGQVQADELRVRVAGGVVWMALAMVVSSRLWLGGVVSTKRDRALIDRLAALVARTASGQRLMLVVDGFAAYVEAFKRACASYLSHPKGGRRTCVPWAELVIAQVVKRAPSGEWLQHRLVHGSVRSFLTGLWSTPGCQVLNTAYIERLNGTFRARLAPLVRRTRALARHVDTLTHGMNLVGACYNFCTVHSSLTTRDGQRRTPAMAAGITDHLWSIRELLSYRVPPPRWVPPRRVGRRSRAFQALIDRWAPTHH